MSREDSWSHHGLWGKVTSRESRHLADCRGLVESGIARGRDKTEALTLSRYYELARKCDNRDAAAKFEACMATLNERVQEKHSAPRKPRKLGKTGLYIEKKTRRNGNRVDSHVKISSRKDHE